MADTSTSVVKCQCGVKLRVPPNAAGKRIRCPKCGFRLQIPAEGQPVVAMASAAPAASPPRRPAAAPSPPPPPPVPDESDSLLSDLMESEAAAATSAGPDLAANQKLCPSCNTPMAKGAAKCVHCGHDCIARPGGAAAGAPAKKSGARKLAIGGGKFALGCTLSAAGALVGAGIWYAIAVNAYVEIGYVAWAVGLLAGFGMLWGYGKQDFLAALVATGMALGGIFAAKWMIYNKFIELAGTSRVATAFYTERRCQEPFDRRGLPDWADERVVCEDVGSEVFEMSDREYARHDDEVKSWAEDARWQDPEYAKSSLAVHYASLSLDDAEETIEPERADEAWNKAHTDAL
ncbi:MAG TPA: hypothetical protein P5572_18915, partial [Phycisphaerae bacterium]|nr:hypothetical protein [Phycisphaerae bacterium]